jgi:hypothetical protein
MLVAEEAVEIRVSFALATTGWGDESFEQPFDHIRNPN